MGSLAHLDFDGKHLLFKTSCGHSIEHIVQDSRKPTKESSLLVLLEYRDLDVRPTGMTVQMTNILNKLNALKLRPLTHDVFVDFLLQFDYPVQESILLPRYYSGAYIEWIFLTPLTPMVSVPALRCELWRKGDLVWSLRHHGFPNSDFYVSPVHEKDLDHSFCVQRYFVAMI